MNLRRPLLALAAGVATLGLVAVTVIELLAPTVEFSALVGLPVGLLAGVAVAIAVFLGLDPDDGTRRRRTAATAVGVFGAVTLLAFALATVAAGASNSRALPIAVGAGVLGALASAAVRWRSGAAALGRTA